MTYQEWRATFPGAVGWTVSATGPGLVLPDGCMDLLLLDDRMVIAGPDTAAFMSESSGPVHGIRFPPGVLAALLGVPAADLRNQRVPFDAVVGRAARAQTLMNARSAPGAADPHQRLRVLATRLATAHDGELAGSTRHVVDTITSGQSVRAIAAQLGWSERHFLRFCRDRFGYGANTLRRILQLQRALAHYRSGGTLAAAAAGAGFADHAHLTRTCRQFTGLVPTRLIGAQTSSGE